MGVLRNKKPTLSLRWSRESQRRSSKPIALALSRQQTSHPATKHARRPTAVVFATRHNHLPLRSLWQKLTVGTVKIQINFIDQLNQVYRDNPNDGLACSSAKPRDCWFGVYRRQCGGIRAC
jgi:hypothetical protein